MSAGMLLMLAVDIFVAVALLRFFVTKETYGEEVPSAANEKKSDGIDG